MTACDRPADGPWPREDFVGGRSRRTPAAPGLAQPEDIAAGDRLSWPVKTPGTSTGQTIYCRRRPVRRVKAGPLTFGPVNRLGLGRALLGLSHRCGGRSRISSCGRASPSWKPGVGGGSGLRETGATPCGWPAAAGAGDRGGHFPRSALQQGAVAQRGAWVWTLHWQRGGRAGMGPARPAVDLALIAYLHLPAPGACRCAAGGRASAAAGWAVVLRPGMRASQLGTRLRRTVRTRTCSPRSPTLAEGGDRAARARTGPPCLRPYRRGQRDRQSCWMPRHGTPRRPTHPRSSTAARPGLVGS